MLSNSVAAACLATAYVLILILHLNPTLPLAPAYGASVAGGGPPARASVVDVMPTILYFLGLPIGRDMDGYARTDLFCRRSQKKGR
jgi:hypothetical protein